MEDESCWGFGVITDNSWKGESQGPRLLGCDQYWCFSSANGDWAEIIHFCCVSYLEINGLI